MIIPTLLVASLTTTQVAVLAPVQQTSLTQKIQTSKIHYQITSQQAVTSPDKQATYTAYAGY